MAAAVEAKFDAAVFEALAAEAFADTEFVHELDGVVFEEAGADALFDVGAGVELEDDGLDAEALQEEREEEAGGSGADDGDLGTHGLAWKKIAHRGTSCESRMCVSEVVEAQVLGVLELELDAGDGIAPVGAEAA